MLIVFGILIILSSVILGLIVLVQNPKGGGFSNQLMGVKQTTDVLEKGTWFFAGIVAILCIASSAFIPSATGTSSKNDELIKNAPASLPSTKPTNAVPITTPGADSPKSK